MGKLRYREVRLPKDTQMIEPRITPRQTDANNNILLHIQFESKYLDLLEQINNILVFSLQF